MARILLVDDHDDVRRAMTRALQRMGHAVTQAADGRHALSVLEGEPLDVVVTDINMPGMDGIELTIAVGKRWPRVPIIAVSGGGMLPKELLLENAAVLGAVTTLTKPIDFEELRAAVEAALEGGARQEPPPGG